MAGKSQSILHRSHRHRLWVVLFVFAFSFISPHALVRAQTDPSMSILPADAQVYLDGANSVTVDVMLVDAVDMQSFDVTFEYDPSVMQLDSFIVGDFVSTFTKLFEDQSSGFLQVAYVKLGSPSVSGSGVLLRLTFSGVAIGTSAITITDGLYAKSTGVKVYPTLQSGSLKVLNSPVSVTGEFSLQGQTDRGGVTVTLGMGETFAEGPYMAVSLNQAGANLDFGGVIPDTYPVTTSQPRYLNVNAAIGKRVVISTATILSPLRLVSGNAVWTDDVIDAGDASLVGAWYGKTTADLEPGQTLDADVNFDSVVNVKDLALVAGNYGLTSAAAYAGWLP